MSKNFENVGSKEIGRQFLISIGLYQQICLWALLVLCVSYLGIYIYISEVIFFPSIYISEVIFPSIHLDSVTWGFGWLTHTETTQQILLTRGRARCFPQIYANATVLWRRGMADADGSDLALSPVLCVFNQTRDAHGHVISVDPRDVHCVYIERPQDLQLVKDNIHIVPYIFKVIRDG